MCFFPNRFYILYTLCNFDVHDFISPSWLNLETLWGCETELTLLARCFLSEKSSKARNDLEGAVCVDLGESINIALAEVGYIIYFDRLPIFLFFFFWFRPNLFKFWTKAYKSQEYNWPPTVECTNHVKHFLWVV